MTEWLKRNDAETTTSVAVHSSVRSDTKVHTMKLNRSTSFRSLCQCRHYMLVQIYRTEQHQLVLEVAAFLFQFLRDVTQLTVQRFHVTRLYKRQEKGLQPLAHNYSAEFRYFQDNSWSSRHCPAMPGTNYRQWYVSGLATMKLLPLPTFCGGNEVTFCPNLCTNIAPLFSSVAKTITSTHWQCQSSTNTCA